MVSTLPLPSGPTTSCSQSLSSWSELDIEGLQHSPPRYRCTMFEEECTSALFVLPVIVTVVTMELQKRQVSVLAHVPGVGRGGGGGSFGDRSSQGLDGTVVLSGGAVHGGTPPSPSLDSPPGDGGRHVICPKRPWHQRCRRK